MVQKRKAKKTRTKSKKPQTRAKARKASREALVVGSKIKNYVRENGMMASSDLLEALSDRVYHMLDDAVTRSQANKRSTVRPHDI